MVKSALDDKCVAIFDGVPCGKRSVDAVHAFGEMHEKQVARRHVFVRESRTDKVAREMYEETLRESGLIP